MMIHDGVHIHPHSTPSKITQDSCSSQLSVTLSNGQVHSGFDEVLVATGRLPSTDNMNLQAAGFMFCLFFGRREFSKKNLIIISTTKPSSNPIIMSMDGWMVGVALSRRGHVEVDEYQNTSANHVYALGWMCCMKYVCNAIQDQQINHTPTSHTHTQKELDNFFCWVWWVWGDRGCVW